MASAPAAPHLDDVAPEDVCYRCGYALRGVPDDGPCPECGLLAGRSRRATDELHNTRPGWLRKLSWGVRLVLLALLAMVGWIYVRGPAISLLAEYDPNFQSYNWTVYYHSRWIGMDVGAVLVLAGVLLLTSREGYAPADAADTRRRWLMRGLALLFVAVCAGRHLKGQPGGYYPMRSWFVVGGREDWIALALFLLATLAMAPLPVLLFAQLRSLAQRARSAHLAEHCTIVGIGNGLTLLYIAAFGLLSDFAGKLGLGTYWQSRSTVALALIAILIVSSMLFLMWNVYLLVRFSFAFGKAARTLRAQWRQADRAAEASPAAG